ncbi:MAG: isocitrate/isopropylmalate dehydrogenase family protein [Candidatus Bathyarchaeia archaeon]
MRGVRTIGRYRLAVIPGDGIGPEQTQATITVLEAVEKVVGLDFEIVKVEAGDDCLKRRGSALPEETLAVIKDSVACLKGPVGETAADVIVKLRLMFDLYVNLRPIKAYPNIPAMRPDIDLVIVRENTEDLYKGIEFMINRDTAAALRVISREGSHRIAEFAFKLAGRRRKRVTAVHKANVLKLTDGLFSQVCREVASRYPQITYDELYVDAAAMHLIKRPHEFDVMVMPNLFGDILSDEAAQLVGGLGMAPGANIGRDFAIFEPIHGSAPKHAGKQRANPCSMILAAALLLDWLGESKSDQKCLEAALRVESAVRETLAAGVMTPDLGGNSSTFEVASAIAGRISG